MARTTGWSAGFYFVIFLCTTQWSLGQTDAPASRRTTPNSTAQSSDKANDARSLGLPSEKANDRKIEMKEASGKGGETRQQTVESGGAITTQQGVTVSDNQNTLRQGSRGPALMEDQVFREKLFHFDHERIPERVVHARGFGAHGYLKRTNR